jgi:4'-phosphopantetheinyl transferase EntD
VSSSRRTSTGLAPEAFGAPALERALEDEWGLRVRLAVADRLLQENLLTSGESSQLADLTAPARRESWLRGRAALKELLAALGESADTSRLRFPHPRVSLSHSAANAVAAGTDSRETAGLGVDLELRAPPRVEAARFFMAPDEKARLEQAPPQTLLRLWTVKEAAFKADPGNALSSLRAYRIEDPDALSGSIPLGPRSLRYRSFPLPGGYLSVAVLR